MLAREYKKQCCQQEQAQEEDQKEYQKVEAHRGSRRFSLRNGIGGIDHEAQRPAQIKALLLFKEGYILPSFIVKRVLVEKQVLDIHSLEAVVGQVACWHAKLRRLLPASRAKPGRVVQESLQWYLGGVDGARQIVKG